jgi:DedD protein
MSTDARDARGLPEDGFHEIQLSGKQLVFLFMATTVVSIVIFLCGVLVGRGARTEGNVGEAATPAPERTAELVPANPATPAQKSDAPAPPVEEPTPTTEDLSYYDRLGAAAPAAEQVAPAPEDAATKGAADRQAAASAAATKAAPPTSGSAAAAAPAAGAAPGTASAPPAGSGRYTLQVAAVRTRSEADVIAKRLTGRGYPAYVDASSGRGTKMYRVRVGAFKDRNEAEPMRQRLEKEEKFKPWVTTR